MVALNLINGRGCRPFKKKVDGLPSIQKKSIAYVGAIRLPDTIWQ